MTDTFVKARPNESVEAWHKRMEAKVLRLAMRSNQEPLVQICIKDTGELLMEVDMETVKIYARGPV